MDFPITWAVSSGISLMDILTVIWYVFLILIGINMLIIVHEFGHFIVARMCGVRCDKFYIWFDIYGWRFCRFKWGDTEYGIGVLPLGGYVKMFGQEDSPGAIKAEIERAKLAAQQKNDAADAEKTENGDRPQLSQQELETLEKSLYAPDSYLSKSVPQRMAIIVAGVVMNVIFAFICGIGAYMFGFNDIPCVVGGTSPGSAAWMAELQPGDKILSIDDKPAYSFTDISQSIVNSTSNEIKLAIQRPGVDTPIELQVVPVMTKHDLHAKVGISLPGSLKLHPFAPIGSKLSQLENKPPLKGGETLIAVNDQEISDYNQLKALEYQLIDQPLRYTFRKKGTEETVDVELPPCKLQTLGFAFTMGPITAVRPEAQAVGFAVGDIIQSVNGESIDPLDLPETILRLAYQGEQQLRVTVKRGNETQSLEIPIALDTLEKKIPVNISSMGSAILGIAYDVGSTIGSSTLGSVELPIGATVTGMTVLDSEKGAKELKNLYKDYGTPVKDGFCYTNVDRAEPFPFLLNRIVQSFSTGTKVVLHVKKGDEILDFPLSVLEKENLFEQERGLNFAPLFFNNKAGSFGEAVQLGSKETVKWLLAVYHFIRNLTVGQATGTSRISAKGMGGPISIVMIAYSAVSEGMGKFLWLLCLIGANLAVLNILPIPVLDGGHLVFLAYEAIFRKPPNENVQIILSYLGLALLLALMVWVFALDLGFIKRM